MRLETERLVLRRWTEPADRDAFAAICQDPEVMQWLGGVIDRPAAEARIAHVEATFDRLGHGRFLAERRADAAFLGWCGVMPAHDTSPMAGEPEIGWRLVRDAWGQGYATEMARAALDDAFGRLGMDGVWAYTSTTNLRSQAVMARLGMTRMPERDFDYATAPPDDPHRHAMVWIATPTGRR